MQGHSDNGAPDSVLMYDQSILNEIEDVLNALDAERDALMTQIAGLDRTIKRYEKARRALEGEPTAPKVNPAKERSVKQRATALKGLARSDTWPSLREMIITYGHHHTEFTQSEFRKEHGGVSSGKSSLAFELLREENVLRVARIDGNFKYYRLTKEAINAQ